jgi:CheY-like chemotaxis protein
MAGFQDQLRRLSLVVVDDNSTHCLIASETLRGLGAGTILNAASANILFELARVAPIDLVFCDWRMRDMDGITLTRQIRLGETPLAPDIPIVMVTSEPTAGAVAQARQACADEFVAKPYAIATLATRFEAVVMKRRPFIRTAVYVGPCRRRRIDVDCGQNRRLFDEMPKVPAEARWAQAVIAVLLDVRRLAGETAAGDRAAIRRLLALLQDAQAPYADRATRKSLNGLQQYIEGVGASGAFEGVVVETHAAGNIEMLRHPDDATRMRMSAAPCTLVQKRLARAAS